MKTRITRVTKDATGATAVEYGLIALLVAVAIIVGATALGNQLNATFQSFSSSVSTADSGSGAALDSLR